MVLINNWQLPENYQKKLLEIAHAADVFEIILVGNKSHEVPSLLKKEPKIRHCQVCGDSPLLMAEAAAFEASAEVLVILKQGVMLTAQAIREIPLAIIEGYLFGGFIKSKSRWSAALLKIATIKCKGFFWFRITKGYFMSRQVYHHAGGFKQNGRLISFSELLCKQQKLSPYKLIVF